MRSNVFRVGVFFCLVLSTAIFAQPPQVNSDDLRDLFKSLNAPHAGELPRTFQTTEGYVRFIAAPPGTHYSLPASAAKASVAPASSAVAFLKQHAAAFAAPSANTNFSTESVSAEGGRTYVRVQQQYGGLNVFGGEAILQLDTQGVASVLTEIMRDPTSLDNGTVSLTPALADAQAETAAIAFVAAEYKTSASALTSTDSTRVILDPTVVKISGAVCLAWETTVYAKENSNKAISEEVFVDAQTGNVVFHYSHIQNVRQRNIYDANEQFVLEGTLVRAEGDDPCGITDADDAYDFFGDTYDFYKRVHNRDSIDDKGLPIQGTVRYCMPGECPLENAFYVLNTGGGADTSGMSLWLPDHMYFGEGFASAVDVIGHELTHGVTSYTSNLVYSYQSGAIDESFSDMWGTWIKLTNGRRTYTADERWLLGEATPIGAIRDMKNPPAFGQPDRVGSPLYYTGTADNGGVHQNNGVCNKMAYLLTDGDTFNGQTVTGMGIEPTAKLFYECQVHLLPSTADFTTLYFALGQATVNLGYTFDQRVNVQSATRAVEIAPPIDNAVVNVFRAISTMDQYGRPVIALNWVNPPSTYFKQVILVRDTAKFPSDPNDGTEIFQGRDESFLDTVDDGLVAGTRYFYSLFVDLTAGFPARLLATAVAGGVQPDFLSESFSTTASGASENHPIDLGYTQILFSPTGASTSDFGQPQVYADYSNYTATIKKGVYDLPVPASDQNGGSFNLTLTDDGVVPVAVFLTSVLGMTTSTSTMAQSLEFPFFGKTYTYSDMYLSSNGYISFVPVLPDSADNFPSYATHFDVPRVSFLFSDLAPHVGGHVWARMLDDRFVLTFIDVPELGVSYPAPQTNPNTVQVELFTSGHIRITYLNLSAQTAVAGISDGHGVPTDPATIFDNVQSVPVESDLSMAPTNFTALTLDPIPPQQANPGDTISFTVHVNVPDDLTIPLLSAQWDNPGMLPFIDNHDGTGRFMWIPTLKDMGTFNLRITAQLGTTATYQDVMLTVGPYEPLPEAYNLRLLTDNPVEDPTRDRVVDIDTQLTAQYDYRDALERIDPTFYGQGATEVLWYMNNVYMPAFANQMHVPEEAVKSNQSWFFTVKPKTVFGINGPVEGKVVMSPTVTVIALPNISNVVLSGDAPTSVDPASLPLPNLPAAAGPSEGGTKVVILGKRLTQPTSVHVGGVPVDPAAINAVNDNRIEIVTPAHQPSAVANGVPIPEDVTVSTAAGTGLAHEAFTYVAGKAVSAADVNRDGKVDAVDVQLVINAILQKADTRFNEDVNRDGHINAADIQLVVNAVMGK